MPEVRLIDANAFAAQYGDYYAEEGPEEGFIGTVGDLIAKQPTIEAEPVRHGRWERHSSEQIECLESGIYRILSTARCSVCRRWAEHVDDIEKIVTYDVCPNCGAKMNGGING